MSEPVAPVDSGLVVTGAAVTFPDATTPALDDVSVAVPRGRVLAVLGPSGCGKSTLLRVVAGLQKPNAGRVAFGGVDVTAVPTHRRDFALMFQDGQLFGHLDVFENVAYALRRRRVARADVTSRVRELLVLVGLEGAEKRSPATLSGGQQQRVALARALAARPRLLLLDEPLSALDRSLRERLAVDLREILRAEGTTALMVTHDHDEALTVADDMAIMREGRIVQQGPAQEVWRRPSDVATAEFLGFTTHLAPDEASALGLEPAAGWSLRRGGLRIGLRGSGADAQIQTVSAAGESVHARVELAEAPGRVLEGVVPDVDLAVNLTPGTEVGVVVNQTAAVRFS